MTESENPTPAEGTAVPPAESTAESTDDDLAHGYVVQVYAGRPDYARFAVKRPRTLEDPTQAIRGRDRLRRVAPVSFTNPNYRSTTGQTSRSFFSSY